MEKRIVPAEHVIEIFGGITALAKRVNRSKGAVGMWRADRLVGGRGGYIPTESCRVILEIAIEEGLDITAEDLLIGRATSSP